MPLGVKDLHADVHGVLLAPACVRALADIDPCRRCKVDGLGAVEAHVEPTVQGTGGIAVRERGGDCSAK